MIVILKFTLGNITSKGIFRIQKILMLNRKGIILAGGNGSRLYPLTYHISKQLLPVYDKPMIFYPISTLMSCGVKDILIITQEKFVDNFKLLLEKTNKYDLNISFEIQNEAKGIAEALIIAENFLNGQKSILILGDNIIFGQNIERALLSEFKTNKNVIFTKKVSNPERYGVVKYKNNKIEKIIEKPKKFTSNDAVIGLYFFEKKISNLAKLLKPSNRGELEITDLNNVLIQKKRMIVKNLDDEVLWFDAGTHDSLLQCSNFVESVQKRSGKKITKIY